jgi:hypothetical protein
MAGVMKKGLKIIDLLNSNPMKSDKDIAWAAECSPEYVRQMRKKMAHVEPTEADKVAERIAANQHEVPDRQQHLIREHLWDGVGERVWCRHGIDLLGEPCVVCVPHNGMCIHNYRTDEYCPVCNFTPATAEDFSECMATPEVLDAVLEAEAVLNKEAIGSIDAILNERGSRYGSFVRHAYITQRLKAVMADTPNWLMLDDDMIEALEMVAHKIGRILNGDPKYADSWVDIAGYAQLVADRLEGKER